MMNDGSPPTIKVYFFAVFLLAWLTYQFIERPIRSRKPGTSRRTVVAGLLSGGAILAVAGLAIVVTRGLPERFAQTLRPFLSYTYAHNASYGSWCFVQSHESIKDWNESRCVDAQTDPKMPLLVLWGDSHAAHLLPGLRSLQRDQKFRIAQMTAAGCPPFPDFDMPGRPFCRPAHELFKSKIAELKPDIVVVATDWFRYGEFGIKPVEPAIEGLQRANIQHIVVVGPVPQWYDLLPDTMIRAAVRNSDQIPATLGPELRVNVPETGFKTLAKNSGASYISPVDALCPAGRCVTMTDYGPQYLTSFDTSHLTDPGSQLLVQRIADQLFMGVAVGRR
jgi:hypothetical protein